MKRISVGQELWTESLTQSEYDEVRQNISSGLGTLSEEELTRWATVKILAQEARSFCFLLKFEEAKKKYQEALDIIPGYCSLELSDLFMFEDNYVDAEKVWMFDRGKMRKRDWEAYWQVSEMYGRWGMWDKATEILQEATRKMPRDQSLFYSLGKIYEIQGRYKEAEVAYRRALKISKGSGPYCLCIAEALILDERADEAVSFLEEVMAKEDNFLSDFWPSYLRRVKDAISLHRRNVWRLHPLYFRKRLSK